MSLLGRRHKPISGFPLVSRSALRFSGNPVQVGVDWTSVCRRWRRGDDYAVAERSRVAERKRLSKRDLRSRPFGELRHRVHVAGGSRLGGLDLQFRFRHAVSIMHIDLALSERDFFGFLAAYAG